MDPERPKRGGKDAPRGETKPAGAYHHGNLREALVAAALDLIDREGAQGLTLRKAARAVGVSEAAPYRHFADKRALLSSMAEEGFRMMTAFMERRVEGVADPVERLQRLGVAYVLFACAHRAHFRVMTAPDVADKEDLPELQEAAATCFGLLLGALRECQDAGLVRAGDTRELAMSAWALVHGLSALLVDGQVPGVDADDPDAVERWAETVGRHLQTGLATDGPA